jgi:hypothetical protein
MDAGWWMRHKGPLLLAEETKSLWMGCSNFVHGAQQEHLYTMTAEVRKQRRFGPAETGNRFNPNWA